MQSYPGILQDIAEIASPEAAEAVAAGLGGRRMAIGKRPRADHPLRDYLTDAELDMLADRIMGDRVEIPNLKDRDRSVEARRLRRLAYQLRARGVPVSLIAETLKIRRPTAQRFLRGGQPG